MADQIEIPPDLKARFAEIGQIADLAGQLREKLDQINQANKDAAGQDDKTAKTYHAQVDGPTEDLSTLVDQISQLFGATSTSGTDAADIMDQADDAANEEARAW